MNIFHVPIQYVIFENKYGYLILICLVNMYYADVN